MESGSSPSIDAVFADGASQARIVVVGRGYANILNMVRSFGEAGHRVDVLRVFKNASSTKRPLLSMKPEASSKYVSRYAQCIAACEQDLIDALMTYADPKAKKIVIPVDDFVALTLDHAREALSASFMLPGLTDSSRGFDFYMRKDVQKELASAAGLNVVPGSSVSVADWSESDAQGVCYPCFVKPNVSAASSKSKLARCDTPESLNALMARCLCDGDDRVLIEDCVDIAEERSVIGLSVGGQVACPGFIRALKTGRGQRRGVMLAGEVLPASQMQDVVDACCRLVLEVGFEGVFDIDLLVSKDGTVYFAELNFRPGASTYAMVASGCNLPAVYADHLLSGLCLVDAGIGECAQRVFANEKVLLEECAIGQVKPRQMRSLVSSADITFVANADDPAPYGVFKAYLDKAWLLYLRGKLRAILR